MSALAQPEVDGGFQGLRLVEPIAPEQQLPKTQAQLASWLVGLAVDINAVVNNLCGGKNLQSGADSLGEWIALPASEGDDTAKSMRWYRAMKASTAVMRVMDCKTQLPDSMLIIPAIAAEDDLATVLGINNTQARYTEYTQNWLPNANVARYSLRWSEIPKKTQEKLKTKFTERIDMAVVPQLQQRLNTTYHNVSPFLKSGEMPGGKGVVPVTAYAEAVEESVTRLAAVGTQGGSAAAQVLVNRFNIV